MQMLSQLSYRPELGKCTAIGSADPLTDGRSRTYHRRVRIDLNADVGEWTGDDPAREIDAALMALVTTVNIACGAHAGDATTMAITVDLAAFNGLAIGAHPGYPDREGFGRRKLDLTSDEVRATLFQQIGALADICASRGTTLTHVKPHGALYSAATRDPDAAHAIAWAVKEIDDQLALFGPPGSALLAAAHGAGLRGIPEGFGDRTYEPDGTLRPRSLDEAVLSSDSIPLQVWHLACERQVMVVDENGARLIAMPTDTVCFHSDTPDVVVAVRSARGILANHGVVVLRFDAP